MPSDVPGSCPSEAWKSRADFCYFFDPDAYVTWEQAGDHCTAIAGPDAALASIHDENENAFVQYQLREHSISPVWRNAWLGLVGQDPDNGTFEKTYANIL